MRQEKSLLATSVCGLALALLELKNIYHNGPTLASKINLIINAWFCVAGFFGNRKLVLTLIIINFFAVSLLGLPVNYFYVILLFFIYNCKKKIKILFVMYWLSSLAQVIIRPETAHLLQHLVMSAGAFFLFTSNKTNNHFILQLTEDEAYILSELMQGKQQKEIAKWNKNTVSKKLKQARERNNILSNAELLLIYRETEGLLPHNAD